MLLTAGELRQHIISKSGASKISDLLISMRQCQSRLTPELISKHGDQCRLCDQVGHWKSDCGIKKCDPKAVDKWKEKSREYETGWKGEELAFGLLQILCPQIDLLWLNKRVEYFSHLTYSTNLMVILLRLKVPKVPCQAPFG